MAGTKKNLVVDTGKCHPSSQQQQCCHNPESGIPAAMAPAAVSGDTHTHTSLRKQLQCTHEAGPYSCDWSLVEPCPHHHKQIGSFPLGFDKVPLSAAHLEIPCDSKDALTCHHARMHARTLARACATQLHLCPLLPPSSSGPLGHLRPWS